MSQTLKLPLTIEIDDRILQLFKEIGISTAWDIDDFDNNQGWLSELSNYTFKSEITIEGPCAFYAGLYDPNSWTAEGGLCSMGAYSYAHSSLPEGLTVGRYCSIAKGLKFLDFMHPTTWLSSSVAMFKPQNINSTSSLAKIIDRQLEAKNSVSRKNFDPKMGKSYPIIGNDVWIGENVTLSMGIRIHTGAIIASGAIVTKDVPSYAIVGGNPARVLKYRFMEETIKRLLNSRWWEYDVTDFGDMDITSPNKFLDLFEKQIASDSVGTLKKWKPEEFTLQQYFL